MIEKIKSLSKDTLTYGVSTIVGRFLNFFLVPFYTNKFLPAEFGVVAILYSYIAILNVFFSIGMESGYMKFASTKEVGTEKENFSNPLLAVLMNSFFLSFLIFIFANDLTGLFQIEDKFSSLIRYSALILFFDAIVLIPFAYLRLNFKARTFALIRIVSISVNVLLNIILISFFKFGIEAVFISNLVSSVITLILLMPVILKNIALKFNGDLLKELFKFSLPYIPAGIAANIVQIINRPILKYLTDDATVGIFQANYRLGIFMMLVVSMFEFAWRPFFLSNANEPNAKNIFSKVMTLFIIAASTIFLIITVLINGVVMMNLPFNVHLIGKAYWSGLDIVPVILFAYILNGIYVNLMAGIYIEKKTKYLPVITGAGALVNVIANFALIPQYSYMGSAVATLLSYLVMMIGNYYFSNKYYPITYEYRKIFLTFISLLSITILYFYLDKTIGIPFYLKMIIPVAFVGTILLLRIIDFKSMSAIYSGGQNKGNAG